MPDTTVTTSSVVGANGAADGPEHCLRRVRDALASIRTDSSPTDRVDAELEVLERSIEAEAIARREIEKAQAQALVHSAQVLEELEDARAESDRANRVKSEFLANMSHEIRTPLGGILGFTQLLLERADGGDTKLRDEWIRTIDRSGRHLLELVNDILDLEKIEAGMLNIERIPCAVRPLIEDVVATQRPRAHAKGLALECLFRTSRDGDGDIIVLTDPTRLRQLIGNLVGNAIKFTEKGGVTIEVDYDAEHGRLAVDVVDTGIGISPEQADVLFEPFVQADTSITRRFGGTGLGLAISRHIAESLGGFVRIESEPGRGSRFRVETSAESAPLDSVLTESTPQDRLPDALPLRVLIADDVPVNRQLARTTLERFGAKTECATNGREAVDRALEGAFDLILMDMQMPIVDGFDATRELRARGVDVPIVALTAQAMEGDDRRCLAAGCTDFLGKPFLPNDLVRCVAQFCRQDDGDSTSTSLERTAPVTGPDRSTDSPTSIDRDDPAEDAELNVVTDDLLVLFAETLTTDLKEIEQAEEAGDFARLARVAHRIRGACGYFGEAELADSTIRLERALLADPREDFAEPLRSTKDLITGIIARANA